LRRWGKGFWDIRDFGFGKGIGIREGAE